MSWNELATSELTREICLARLETARVGVVSMTIGALPAAFPVPSVLWHGDIVLRAPLHGKMLQAMTGQVVSHLAFEVSPDLAVGWGVLTTGRGEVLSSPADVASVRSVGLVATGPEDVFIRIPTEIMVGYELAAQQKQNRVTSQVRRSNEGDASVSGQY